MGYQTGMNGRSRRLMGGLLAVSLGCTGCAIAAQDTSRLDAGTVIAVRTNQAIDSDRPDNRVYAGTVDEDVRGDRGGIVVPRGSSVELFVRVARDNDLILDLESIVANGTRYAVKAEPKREEASRDHSLVGAIVGAISGGQVRGRAVRIPRESVVTFRLERPLEVGVPDRGIDRDGGHYHDRDDRDHDRDGR
jgi:hypothetical protein